MRSINDKIIIDVHKALNCPHPKSQQKQSTTIVNLVVVLNHKISQILVYQGLSIGGDLCRLNFWHHVIENICKKLLISSKQTKINKFSISMEEWGDLPLWFYLRLTLILWKSNSFDKFQPPLFFFWYNDKVKKERKQKQHEYGLT